MLELLVCRRKAKRFSIGGGVARVNQELQQLPDENTCYKFVSDGSYSSICFIAAIAAKAKIKSLLVSTFAIGKKEMLALKCLSDKGQLDKIHFCFQKRLMDYKNGYTDLFLKICREKGWTYSDIQNHSKVLLFDTECGKFVLETSSNLNENPRIEQFSLERDDSLFEFYKKYLFGL